MCIIYMLQKIRKLLDGHIKVKHRNEPTVATPLFEGYPEKKKKTEVQPF